MRTTTEAAVELRKHLKSRGWNSRMVGVRSDYYSMGSSLRVTVKSPEVCFGEVERAAEEYERVRRCEITGDILSGGNRYVSVSLSDDCRQILARRHWDAFEAALVELGEADSSSILIPIHGTDSLVGKDGPGDWGLRLWHGGGAGMAFNRSEENISAKVALALRDPDQVDPRGCSYCQDVQDPGWSCKHCGRKVAA